ncbi:MAG: T9SS type A sorting domain-containing protein [Ferruginibacter sp.]
MLRLQTETPSRTTPAASDILIIDGTPTPTPTLTGITGQTIGQLIVKNNANAKLQASATAALVVGNGIDVQSGSTLDINSSSAINITFSSGAVNTIAGTFTATSTGSGSITTTNSTTTVTGTVTLSNSSFTVTSAAANLTFSNGSTCNMTTTASTIPLATWGATSTLNITGVVGGSSMTNAAQSFGNLTYNCTGATATMSFFTTNTVSIQGNLSIQATNTGKFRCVTSGALTVGGNMTVSGAAVIDGASGAGSVTVNGNFTYSSSATSVMAFTSNSSLSVLGSFTISAGTFDLASGSAAQNGTLRVGGTFNQSGGTITETGTSTATTIEFNGSSAQSVTLGTINNTVSYRVNNNAGINLTGTMAITTGAGLRISSTAATPINGGTLTYTGTTTLTYDGTGNQTPTNNEWPAASGPTNITINNTGTAGSANRVSLHAARTIAGTLTMTSGVFQLGGFDLTIASTGSVTGTASNTNFIATNGIGQLIQAYAATGSKTYPLGDVTGTDEASAVTVNYTALTGTANVGFRVIDAQDPNDVSPTNYLSRYYVATQTGTVSAGTYTLTINYQSGDVAGTVGQTRVNRWDGATWSQISGTVPGATSASATALNYTTLNATSEFTLRPATISTYTWRGGGSGAWGTGSNWNPTRTVADAADILQFDGSNINGAGGTGAIAVTSLPATETIGRLVLLNNATVSLSASANSVALTIAGGTGTDLDIPSGSSLTFLGTTTNTTTIAYSNTGNTASIVGTLNLGSGAGTGTITYNCANAVTTVDGTVTAGTSTATATVSGATTTTLLVNGTWNHAHNSGTIPTATYALTSNLNVTGITTTAPTPPATVGGNFTWNSTGQTGTALSLTSTLTSIGGTCTIQSTGTGSMQFGTAPTLAVAGLTTISGGTLLAAGGTLTFNGGLTVSSGTISGTSATTIAVNGNFTQSGGTITSSTTTSSVIAMSVTGTFNQSAGTISETSTGSIAINFTGSAVKAVTLNGTNTTGIINYTINNGNGNGITLTGTLNINAGALLTSSIGGSALSGGTVTYTGTGALRYNAATNQTAGTEWPTTNGPASVTIANTGTSPNNVVTAPGSRTISGTLTMTSGDLDFGANTLTLGTSTSTLGTLSYSAGLIRLTSGSVTRWFGTTGLPTATGGTGIGYYPIGFGTNNRNVNIYFSGATALSTGGTITVSHADAVGTTNVNFLDVAYQVDKRTNTSWAISQSGLVAGGTISVRLSGGGIAALAGTSTSNTTLRMIQSAAAAGTFVASSYSAPNFRVDRTGLSVAQLANTHYIGGSNSDIPVIYTAIASTNWSVGTTWDQGSAPGAGDVAIIPNGINVSTDAAVANVCGSLTINTGGTLTSNTATLAVGTSGITNNGTIILGGGSVSTTGSITNGGIITANSGTLAGVNYTNNSGSTLTASGATINISGTFSNAGTVNATAGTVNVTAASTTGITNTNVFGINGATINLSSAGANNRTFANNSPGVLSVISGNLNIFGNFSVASGATFNQSGGTITVDGNDNGNAANSVASGTILVNILSPLGTVSGGTLTIVDPPATGSARSLAMNWTSGNLQWGAGHTLSFGNGVSTDASANTSGFQFDTYVGSTGTQSTIGSLVVAGGNGTNRWATTTSSSANGSFVKGNITINSGSELRDVASGGALVFAGNITNNGTMSMTSVSLRTGSFTGSTEGAVTSAQTIGGTGTFRNSTTSATANLANLTVNNSNASSVTLNGIDLSFSGTITFTLGNIITGANKIILIAGASVSGASNATGYIQGNEQMNFATGSSVSRTFEIGTNRYSPATVNFASVTTGGNLIMSSTNGDHPNLGTSGLRNDLSVNKYWTATNSGIVFTTYALTLNWRTNDNDAGITAANLKVGKFNSPSTWTLPAISGTPTTTSIVTTNSITSFSDFAVAESCPTANAGTVSGTSPLCIGQTATYSSNGDAGGTWTSSDPTKATVDINSGLVTAVAAGTTDITYHVTRPGGCAEVTAFKTLTVSPNYTITASAGAHGSISPNGVTTVCSGGSQAYTITPDACYHVSDVTLNGVSQGAVTSLNVTNVTSNTTVNATFALTTYTITVTPGTGGTITPATGSVNCGDNATYTITPDACHTIADVVVDGVSQGAVGTYTFTNVTAAHTISASFNVIPYTITVTAGANGSITPATGSVNCGSNATYTITPNACYSVQDVVVDGVSQGAVGTYTFTNVTANHTISATFVLNTYTITVTAGANGSITPATGSVNCGDNATYTITPNACYSIADVVVDGVSQGAVGTYTFTNVTANHTISATFVLNTYTITVTAGANGSITPATGSVNCGDNATYTITPNACYSIQDVVVDGVSQGAVGTYTFTNVTANHTISATFVINTYTITVTAGANGSITPATGSVNCGSNATYTITPDACYAIADVIVDGVSQGAVGTYTFTNVTANHTISATFTPTTYTITVTAGANGSITPGTGSHNCGDNLTYTITANACYSIADVVVDGVSQGAVGTYTFTNVTANHTISATFVLNTYTITVTAGANGSITPATGSVNCGDNATYTITPNACYSIQDVVVDGVSQGPVGTYTFTNVTANHTISATFVLNTYTITVTAGSNGSITPGTGSVNCGDNATYTITPNACYSIQDVVVDGVSQGPVGTYTFTNVTANHTISATFVLNTYTITVTAGSNGSITPGTGSVNCGDNATYTITPNACYSIQDVVVDGVSQGPVGTYTFTNVTANHTISATFVLNTYTITVTAGANGSITPGTGSVNCGDNATYTITPNACYSIQDVVVDGVSQGPVGTYTFTNVTANHTISATFVINTYTITVTAGANGSITPATGSVNCGDNATYTITANACYAIADVIVDGVSQGPVGTYTFTNVTANHTISATFVLTTYTITVTAGANGSITPATGSVNCGDNATYTITPDACYSIADVVVDGVSQGAVGTYTFTNVTANHTISATFVLNTYTITVTAGANGSITPATGSVNCGSNATYTITPNACYDIADVVVDGVSQGAVGTYTFTNVTANHTISATFALTNYTITVTAGANGSITPATGSVNCGDNATYTITPNACYAIADVIVDGVSQGPVGTYTFTNVTANHAISATFALTNYTITVTAGANGSITPATGSVNCGDNATYTITPNACYAIADVIVDGVSQGPVGTYTFTNVTANHTISAIFVLNTYTITVTAGANGSITPATGSVNCGDNATYTITPDACYSIADVVVDGVSQGAVGTYTFTNVTANHTISATFALTTYTINASANAGGSITPSGAVAVNCGATQSFTITPNNACQQIIDITVDGVSGQALTTGSYAAGGTYVFSGVTTNHTISVTFGAVAYTITASSTGSGTISPFGVSNVCYNQNQTYTITPDACNSIADVVVDGVSVGAVGTYTFMNVAANHTISATFVLNTYTITVTAGANGSITPATGSVNCGSNATYTITPNACYSIADVVVDGVSQGSVGTYTFTNVTANHTISATFVLNTYTITVTAGANGSITPATGSVNCGANATYTITPNACYAIADVVVDGVSQGAVGTYTFTNVTANHTISATFVLTNYTITVTAGANGSITPATGSVNCGDNATYTITPNACYSIADVVVDGVSQGAVGTYTFTNVTANHTISATFVLNTYTITVTAGANGSITPATGSVNCGANATYTITPNACYSIADVVVDGVSQGAVGTYTFTNVTANHTISATFVINTYTITVTAGANGSITPATGSVNCGANATYTITPNGGYAIADVVVDGVSQGAVGTYTFTNVTANHTISATFVNNANFTINASAGANGSISPNGVTVVSSGGNQSYTITPIACYHVADVLVDGVSVGAVTTYTFTNVTANHTISATFAVNAALSVSVSGPVNVCPYIGTGDQITYTATAAGATGFTWVIPPTNVTIISGQGTANLTVTFQNGFAAQANKQLRVTALSPCGNSPLFVYYLAVQIPSTPQPIVGQTSVCSVIGTPNTLTYTIPSVPGASSYNWVAQQPGNVTITHPNGLGVNDTTVNISFTNSFTSSSITVSASNQGCGTSGIRSLALTKTNPSQPGLISGPTNACPYMAPNGVAASYSIVPVSGATSYTWTVPAGAIGLTGQGTTSISFTYPNTFVSGSVSVTATNGCGTSVARSLSITKLAPATPSVIDIIQVASCPDRIYTYTLTGMPANATSVQWTVPAGGTITNGQGTSSITVSYSTASVNGNVTAQAFNNCGSSTIRSTAVKLGSCQGERSITTKGSAVPATTASVESMQVSVFPNPTVSDFKLQVVTAGKQTINVRILDAQGRSIKTFTVMPYQTTNVGADLKAGAYIMEVRQGNEVKTMKLLKF